MRRSIIIVCLFAAHTVLALPTRRQDSADSDDIEQELIRHHHSTSDDGAETAANPAVQSQGSQEFDSAESRSSNEELFDDESLYDFTVADVLADIIYELKKNPALLEQLIESEREKVEQRIEQMNLARQDSYGDDLSNFQNTAEQLVNEPKRVEKKVGRSGMAVIPGIEQQKRADEVIDSNYARNDVSQETRDFQDFLNRPQEGGISSLVDAADDASESNEGEHPDNTESGSDSIDSADTTDNSEVVNDDAITNYELYQWMQHLPRFQQTYLQGPFTQEQNTQTDTETLTSGQNSAPQTNTDSKEESELSLLENKGVGNKDTDQDGLKML